LLLSSSLLLHSWTGIWLQETELLPIPALHVWLLSVAIKRLSILNTVETAIPTGIAKDYMDATILNITIP
jgi:hypothetical protein